MTEAEWQACEEPVQMLRTLGPDASERKLRLLAVACVRRVFVGAPSPGGDAVKELVEGGEAYADDGVDLRKLNELREQLQARLVGQSATSWSIVSAAIDLSTADLNFQLAARAARQCTITAGYLSGARSQLKAAASAAANVEAGHQARLIREVFGNPFRPISFLPEWRTDAAMLLARGMYESRDFSAMP
ncbi:MAG: hypothetical protein K2V38_07855, partial [Gemmataceae bacterium]|nr:hypothetical protein [Gemmataceae bacterium]